MKRLLVLAVTALVAVGLYATTAGGTQQAVTPAQFNALKKQVATQKKQITQLQNFGSALLAYDLCLTAATADAFQAEWQALDANLTALGRPAVFGPQSPIADSNACQALQITRSHNVPPNTANFGALTALPGASYRYSALSLLLG